MIIGDLNLSELETLKQQLENIKRIWNKAKDNEEIDYVGNGDWIEELDEAINPSSSFDSTSKGSANLKSGKE